MTAAVSVIIPHLNRSSLLRAAVDSVLRTEVQAVEILVVDDGSSPDEWAAIQSLENERVRIFRRETGPRGPSACRNLGVSKSASEFLIFLDSDDILAPWCVEKRLQVAFSDRLTDCWVFPVLLFDERPGDKSTLWNRMDGDADDAMRFVRSDPPWHTSSPLWRKSSFLRLGGFDEAIIYGDDSDLHLRAILTGMKIRKFPEALPDVFVRRSSAPRITNSLNAELLASRLTRLTVGTRLLRSSPAYGKYLRAWSGQYFMEGEFLLFNDTRPLESLQNLFSVWRRDAPTSDGLFRAARLYLILAARARERAYMAVRVLRRAMMAALPPEFFPSGSCFQEALVSPETMQQIQSNLHS